MSGRIEADIVHSFLRLSRIRHNALIVFQLSSSYGCSRFKKPVVNCGY